MSAPTVKADASTVSQPLDNMFIGARQGLCRSRVNVGLATRSDGRGRNTASNTAQAGATTGSHKIIIRCQSRRGNFQCRPARPKHPCQTLAVCYRFVAVGRWRRWWRPRVQCSRRPSRAWPSFPRRIPRQSSTLALGRRGGKDWRPSRGSGEPCQCWPGSRAASPQTAGNTAPPTDLA